MGGALGARNTCRAGSDSVNGLILRSRRREALAPAPCGEFSVKNPRRGPQGFAVINGLVEARV